MHFAKFTVGHHLLLESLFVLCYVIDNRYRKFALPALFTSVFYAAFFMSRVGMNPLPLGDLAFGMRAFTMLLFTSTDLVIRDAQKEYRRIGDKRDVPSLPFRSRLWWAFQLVYNPRGVNWNVEVPGLPPKPSAKTRGQFAIASLRRLCVLIVLDELNKWVLRANPYFTQAQDVQGWQWLWRMYSCGYAFNTWIELSMNYCWFMAFVSALGFTEPSDWPMPFGSITDTYSLAMFWGRAWHATYKRIFITYAKLVNGYFGFKKNTFAASFTGLLVIFFLSAVMHTFGDAAMFDDWSQAGGSIIFFMLQVPGLLFEQAILGLAKRLGVQKPRWWAYVIGYIWVYTWCALTMPYWSDPHIRSGRWGASPAYGWILGPLYALKGRAA